MIDLFIFFIQIKFSFILLQYNIYDNIYVINKKIKES